MRDWLTGLTRFEGVPFGYLVPDEGLLPAESIRFLGVDQTWVRHLVDGAVSVGRLGPADEARDAAAPLPLEFPTLTGALIRSQVVSGYPGLLVDGYADRAGTARLTPWVTRRLGPEVLLCLFEGSWPGWTCTSPRRPSTWRSSCAPPAASAGPCGPREARSGSPTRSGPCPWGPGGRSPRPGWPPRSPAPWGCRRPRWTRGTWPSSSPRPPNGSPSCAPDR
ncbi:hypothetical protein [Micromonospora echinospora]|uniref:hypothetical protein n=1 Tax=Micromonospora echinospora TaxID=1877 RepID=UPI003A857D37